nr:uncharacterized protein LOC109416458 [Aedes albopictus]
MISINKLKPTGSRLSAYALSLQRNSPDVYKRYIDKIRCIFFNDPYTGEIQQSDLPLNVTTGHVVEYFLNFRSPYTGNPMKNSRSLEGYKKYEAGFVHSVSGKIVNGNYVIVGKVIHSMKLRESMLRPWVIINISGGIVAAHCDCIAGSSETCSHVSAVLYFLANLHAQSLNRRETVTDKPAYWRQPPKRIREDLYKRVEDVSYGKITKRFYDRPPCRSHEDFQNLLRNLKSDGANSVVIQSQCDGTNFCCNQCEKNWIPDNILINKNILLQGHFDVENESKSLEELRTVGMEVQLALTTHEVEWVEQSTREQHKSDLWNWVRIGRVTASILKTVVRTSNEVPPPKMTTLKVICHPYQVNIETPATSYGRRNEPLARQYLSKMWNKNHQNSRISECGIFLSVDHPYLAASPDAIGSCQCCGKFSVEMKCPFRLSNKSDLDQQLSIMELANKPDSAISFNGEEFELVKNHQYYYQVQAQIFLTRSDFGLILIWSKSESVVLKVQKDFELWNICVERSNKYFRKIIMPELLGNFYSNKAK